MSDLRAYECLIENVDYYESVGDSFGEYLGSIHHSDDFWGIYYATTPSKAKHQFIKEHNQDYHLGLEYTDPIKVHLLAKNVVQTNNDTGFDEEMSADWCKADLTPRGKEIVDEWLKAVAYITEAEMVVASE